MAKILVIDDNVIMRKTIQFILRRKQHSFLEAEDGPTGIAIARSEKPDLVLLDFMLPYMSGEQVAKYFHEHDELRDIPIIMVTAINQKEVIVNLLQYGVRGYLLKPIKADVLLDRIKDIVSESEPDAETEPDSEHNKQPKAEPQPNAEPVI